jgi:uncharacterized membrane protein YGL010W
MNPYFIEQVRIYSTYHRDARNRATHFIGIPLIVYSLFIPLSWVETFAIGDFTVDLAIALFVATAIYYLWLDRPIGAAMVVIMLPLLVLGGWTAALPDAVGGSVFTVCFVGGWAIQFIGHAIEGRRPALADNLLQALIGPVFLMTEIFLALGWRNDLAAALAVDKRHATAVAG